MTLPVPADPSRKDSPVVNQFAKPIPYAQSFENAESALDDIVVGAQVLEYAANVLDDIHLKMSNFRIPV
ncbi:MAG TPA: hypothetical protein VK589_13670 [Chryseolinea sp.]|nr:hypothetical protein [Chryseolinea sp.]